MHDTSQHLGFFKARSLFVIFRSREVKGAAQQNSRCPLLTSNNIAALFLYLTSFVTFSLVCCCSCCFNWNRVQSTRCRSRLVVSRYTRAPSWLVVQSPSRLCSDSASRQFGERDYLLSRIHYLPAGFQCHTQLLYSRRNTDVHFLLFWESVYPTVTP